MAKADSDGRWAFAEFRDAYGMEADFSPGRL
jgi:hypothetical protein